MTGSATRTTSDWSCGRAREELDAWALGALERDEMAAVERHLQGCAACRDAAARASRAVSLIPFSLSPVSPSAHARHALMVRLADDQMGSVASPPGRPQPVASPAAAPDAPRRRYHWSQVLVAPLAIALLVMTVWSFELRQQVDDASESPGSSELTAGMLPDGIRTFALKSECERCQTAGTLLADPERGDALMVAWDLDPSQVHQVWCEDGDGSRTMVASLNVSESGEVMQPLVFDQPIAGYSRIYVVTNDGETVEVTMDDDPLLAPRTPVPTERR